jgi:hypothetical protein
VDADNYDFRLWPDDTVAKDAGVDLANDTSVETRLIASLQYDAAGNERYDAKWDIGALEAPTIWYRSVGNDTSNLAGDGNTVTITRVTGDNATTTAIFLNPLPDNVGVGDVLQYGGAGYYALAFIYARASSTEYEVRSRDGGTPTATTSAPVSVFRAHRYLENWEAQETAKVNANIDADLRGSVLVPTLDIAASNSAMFVPAYASTSPDTVPTMIDGWTTATSSYIKVYTPVEGHEVGTSQRHEGIWSNEKYRMSIPWYTWTDAVVIEQNRVIIDGLQIQLTGTVTAEQGYNAIYNYSYTAQDTVWITNNIIRNSAGHSGSAIHFDGIRTTGYSIIYNNLIYGFDVPETSESSSGINLRAWYGSVSHVYNNTIRNCVRGIAVFGDHAVSANNNVVFDCGDDFYGPFASLTHNASDDGDGTNAVVLGNETAWKAAFVDYENYDFRIRDTASVLYDAGTTIITVTDDILGVARPQGDAYDIGAFEYVGRPKYRFEGGKFQFEGKFEFK